MLNAMRQLTTSEIVIMSKKNNLRKTTEEM